MSINGLIRDVYKIFRMTIRNRYLGSKLGMVWVIIQPLLQMMIYVLIFGVVLKLKVSGSDSSVDYVIWFFCGFTPWMAINEGILSSASAIISNISLVKNFSIRTEVFPIASILIGLPQMLVGMVVIIILSAISGLNYSIHIVWLLIIIPIMLLFLIGISFFLSAIGVFFRDVIQILPTIIQLAFYATPIFYDIDALPEIVRNIIFFNPLFQICNSFRQILFLHENPNILGLSYVLVLSLILIYIGLLFFRKVKGYFESVL